MIRSIKKWIAMLTVACLGVYGTACSATEAPSSVSHESAAATREPQVSPTAPEESPSVPDDTHSDSALEKIDPSTWQYNEDAGVYFQTGISYCANPVAPAYETLSIFVPETYMVATENDDGTFTCEASAEAGEKYTALSAPIVLPVNTPGYSAMDPLTEYSDRTREYTDAGFVYVHAGCRGRDAGAPAGVTDLKAAIRYLRYTTDTIAGDTDRVFTFGMSGGAQSSILGASGDSDLYTPYLEEIGAVPGMSDATYGCMAWCPITGLDTADESYEWMMGSTRTDLSEEDKAISDALAAAWPECVNSAG